MGLRFVLGIWILVSVIGSPLIGLLLSVLGTQGEAAQRPPAEQRSRSAHLNTTATKSWSAPRWRTKPPGEKDRRMSVRAAVLNYANFRKNLMRGRS